MSGHHERNCGYSRGLPYADAQGQIHRPRRGTPAQHQLVPQGYVYQAGASTDVSDVLLSILLGIVASHPCCNVIPYCSEGLGHVDAMNFRLRFIAVLCGQSDDGLQFVASPKAKRLSGEGVIRPFLLVGVFGRDCLVRRAGNQQSDDVLDTRVVPDAWRTYARLRQVECHNRQDSPPTSFLSTLNNL